MILKHFMWIEKYRPNLIKDIIIPKRIKTLITNYIKGGEIPHLIFSSPNPGTGKTTLAKVIAEELNSSVLFINASDETGVDMIRTKITAFTSTQSGFGKSKTKIVILDEADRLSPGALDALKGHLESHAKHVRFIMTCNNINKFPETILSRKQVVDFSYTGNDKKDMLSDLAKRIFEILDTEKVDYSKKIVGEVILDLFPDMRKTINVLQQMHNSGGINADNYYLLAYNNLDELVGYLKAKKFTDMRKFVTQYLVSDPIKALTALYNKLYNVLEPQSIPEAILIIGEYQFKAGSIMDKEICVVACLTQIMQNCLFK